MLLLKESLNINSLPIDAWIQLISSTISRGKFDIAIKDSEAAIESHPNQPFPYLAWELVFQIMNY